MKKQFSIQLAVPSDLEAADHVFESSISAAFEQEGLEALIDDIQQEIEHKKQLLRASLSDLNPDLFFLTAKHNHNVVGTISYGPCGEEIRKCTNDELQHVGTLGSLYVLPSYQGQGVGSALIRALMIRLQEMEVAQFCLDSGFKIAQTKWLRKFGTPYTVAKDYWGKDGDHMVWLCEVQDFL
ncbi:GNAT family N-acetyltransferase [Paenibacillus kribbensis]|uniref:GNAT family N-acetyltransferase n=1 Tax=Paenibacillus kribbensis TaxID=172713 RepID=UPI002DBDE2A1|nr:GNAT family N-acetyltransferase [Paenibacillus kribbensis]MEC0234891.1 GNAT family N-acetyltransferase [Paenibacillus kribbensis]